MQNIHQKLLTRPTFVEIRLDYIRHNFNIIKNQLKNQKILCVVKGNAYGHGIVEISKLYQQLGADYLAVAIPEEAVELRESGITIPILALSPIADKQIEVCINNNITITAPSDEKIIEVNKVAQKLNKTAKLHIKVDTGMGRIGVNWKRIKKYFSVIKSSKYCHFEGLFSHFALADEESQNNNIQIERFKKVIVDFKKVGIEFPLIHLANTGGIFFYPKSHFNMVRAGISLYGLFENRLLPPHIILKPAMAWKSEIMYFKFIEKGTGIGYGYRFIAKQDTRIVTVPVGHSDGYQRAIAPNGKVIINNHIYPIAGGICMDQLMVDIGIKGEAFKGDPVILVGQSKDHKISFYDLAKWSNTSIYELLAQISFRVPRIYLNK
jgi:alanine racemase